MYVSLKRDARQCLESRKLQSGYRVGVPQGPAYARIIAEMFLDQLLDKILCQFERNGFYVYHYVDDIIFSVAQILMEEHCLMNWYHFFLLQVFRLT